MLCNHLGCFESPSVSCFLKCKVPLCNEPTKQACIYLSYVSTKFKEEIFYIFKVICDLVTVHRILNEGNLQEWWKFCLGFVCAVALIRKRKLTVSIWNVINRQFYKLSATVNFLDQLINGDLIVEYLIPFILEWMLDSSIPRKLATNYRRQVQIMVLSLLATVSFSSFFLTT